VTTGWTIEEAAAILDPPLNPGQVRALVALAGLTPIGKRRSGGRGGRPAAVYDVAALVDAHAVIVPLLAWRAGL
jgi:hypothetical protein